MNANRALHWSYDAAYIGSKALIQGYKIQKLEMIQSQKPSLEVVQMNIVLSLVVLICLLLIHFCLYTYINSFIIIFHFIRVS